MSERDLFLAALDLDDPRARALALDKACAGDAVLRVRVDALLRSHENAGSFLEEPAVLDLDATLTEDEPSDAQAATQHDAAVVSPGESRDFAQAESAATRGHAAGSAAEEQTVGQTRTTAASDSEATTDGPDDLVNLPRGTMVRYFGDYELQKELGRGGMGVVYQARQVSLNRPVALKMIKAGVLAGDAELRRFQNEAEAVALLDHPDIVPVYEVGEHRRPAVLQHEADRGRQPRRAARTTFNDRPRAAAALLVAQTAEAVHHAHMRGILHRDLKPANILIDARRRSPTSPTSAWPSGSRRDVELTADRRDPGHAGLHGPEQAAGRRGTITTATDVYGLGAILYALLTGQAPFGGDSVIETLDAVRTRRAGAAVAELDAHRCRATWRRSA